MSDQCEHCQLRGNLEKCKSVECFHHENWYAVEQQKLLDEANELCERLKNEAQIHAQEARAQKGIVLGIYQDLGIQQGDWNGKVPVIEKFNEANATIEGLREALNNCLEHCKGNDVVTPRFYEMITEALNKTPKQSLAHIQADAVEEFCSDLDESCGSVCIDDIQAQGEAHIDQLREQAKGE